MISVCPPCPPHPPPHRLCVCAGRAHCPRLTRQRMERTGPRLLRLFLAYSIALCWFTSPTARPGMQGAGLSTCWPGGDPRGSHGCSDLEQEAHGRLTKGDVELHLCWPRVLKEVGLKSCESKRQGGSDLRGHRRQEKYTMPCTRRLGGWVHESQCEQALMPSVFVSPRIEPPVQRLAGRNRKS